MERKQCTKCKEWKPLSEFYKIKRSPDGYHAQCKVCSAASNKAWRDKGSPPRKPIVKQENGETAKRCCNCKEWKPVSQFNKNATNATGYASFCQDCHRLGKYDLIPTQYAKLLEHQDDRCAICGKTPEENGRSLAIDHCHSTGTVRGLLCATCNTGLGFFQDDVTFLHQAILYLSSTLEQQNFPNPPI